MKTIIARFQELKKNVSEVEVDGEIIDVNKVETALKSVGIALRDEVTGQFRDLDDVFLELASIWDTLDRNTQRYVATIAAGSRQQSRFIAMMDNYERTVELVDIANKSNGDSAKQFAKTMDSLEAKINKIKSSAENLIGTLAPNQFVKDVLDSFNNILGVINDISKQGPLAITAFSVVAVKVVKNIINQFLIGLRGVSDSIDTVKQSIINAHPKFKIFVEYYDSKTGRKIDDPLNNNGKEIRVKEKITKEEDNKNKKPKSTEGRSGSNSQLINKVSSISSLLGSVLSSIQLIYATQQTNEGLKGSVIGQGFGTLVGGILAAAIPGVGGIIGPLVAPLAGLIGGAMGDAADRSKGILSETFSKLLEESISEASDKASESLEAYSSLNEQISEFEKLKEVIDSGDYSIEEQERYIELNNELKKQYPEITSVYREEIGVREVSLDLLKEELVLKKQLAEQDAFYLKTLELSQKEKDVRQEENDYNEVSSTYNKKYEIGGKFSGLAGILEGSKADIQYGTQNSLEEKATEIKTNFNIEEISSLKEVEDFVSQIQDNFDKQVEKGLLTELDKTNFEKQKKELLAFAEDYFEGYKEIQEKKDNIEKENKIANDDLIESFLLPYDDEIVQKNSDVIQEYVDSYLLKNDIEMPSLIKEDGTYYDPDSEEYKGLVSSYENNIQSAVEEITYFLNSLSEDEKTNLLDLKSLIGVIDSDVLIGEIKKNFNQEDAQKIMEMFFGLDDSGNLNVDTGKIAQAAGQISELFQEEITKAVKSGDYRNATVLSNFSIEWSEGERDFSSYMGIIEGMKSVEDLDPSVISNFTNVASQEITSFSTDLFDASTQATNLITKLQGLEEYKDAIQDGALTKEQVEELIKTYDLTLDSFELTAEGYKLIGMNYYELVSQASNQTDQIYQETLSNLEVMKRELQETYNNQTSIGDIVGAEETKQKLEDIIVTIERYKQAASTIEPISLSVTSMQQAADSIDILVENSSLLNSALEEFDEYGQISANTFADLIQSNSAYIGVIDAVNGKLVLNKEKFEELRQQEIQNYKDSNQISINKLKQQNLEIDAQIESAKASMSTAKTLMEMQSDEAEYSATVNKFKSEATAAWAKVAITADKDVADGDVESANTAVKGATTHGNANVAMEKSYSGLRTGVIGSITSIISGIAAMATAAKTGEDTSKSIISGAGAGLQSAMGSIENAVADFDEDKWNNLLNDDAFVWDDTTLNDYIKDTEERIAYLEGLKNKNNETIQKLEALSELADKISKTGGALGGAGSKKGTSGTKKATKETKEYRLELEKLYNILSLIADSERELEEIQIQRNSLKDYNDLAKNDSTQLAIIEDLKTQYQELLRLQKQEQENIANQLRSTYSAYVQVKDGYLQVNHAAIATIRDQEFGDTLKELIDEFDKYSDSINDTISTLDEYREKQEEIIKTARDYAATLKDQILNQVIDVHEKEIEKVKEKYDAIKNEDSKYLDSLKKNLDKQRQLRDQQDERDDLESKEKRLALLQRDTSGIYAAEIEQLKQEIAEQRQSMADSETDQLIEDLEAQYEAQHQAMDDEVEYLQESHQLKLETMTEYWAEVERIMEGGYSAILDYLKKHDEEFITGSKESQAAWLEEWEKTINEALSYQTNVNNGNYTEPKKETPSINTNTGNNSASSGAISTNKTPSAGSQVKAKSGAKIYGSPTGGTALNPYFGAGPYTVVKTQGSRALVRWYKASSGLTGWFNISDLVGYSEGGLVQETGPVMVHGTKSKPEAFLSSSDTQMIISLKDALSSFTKGKTSLNNDSINQNSGDTYYEIHIEVENISDDYDVEKMIDVMKKEIVKDARNRNVLAIKRSR